MFLALLALSQMQTETAYASESVVANEISAGVFCDSVPGLPEDTLPVQTASAEAIFGFARSQYDIPYHWSKSIPCNVPDGAGQYTLVYQSADNTIAKVNQKGKVTGVSEGTTIITVTTVEDPTFVASYEAVVKKEAAGAYEENGKIYCIDENGERMIGYGKANGAYYYTEKNSYAITEKWKNVKVGNNTYKLYFGKNGKQKQDVSKLIGEQASYRLEVDVKKNMVIVYAKDEKNEKRGYCIPVKAMVCSCGIKGHPTITGTYSYLRQAGKWHPLYYGTYGKYCTRISGPYLFHSVVYTRNGDSCSLDADEYEKLGSLASHGCIRLSVKDAKWIYRRASKCSVRLYRETVSLPLQKPKGKKAVRMKNGKAYDPTDTDVKEDA